MSGVMDYTVALVITKRLGLHYEFLVMDVTRPGDTPVVKFPGGKMERLDRYDPRVTVEREAYEEVGLYLKSFDRLNFLDRQESVEGRFGVHDKFFYQAWRSAFKGQIRKFPIYEANGTLLGVPRWATLEELSGNVHGYQGLHSSHAHLIPKLREIGGRVPHLLVA